MSPTGTQRAELQRWARTKGIADRVVDDPRMPEDPITLADWAYQICAEENQGEVSEEAVNSRLRAIEKWAAEEDFPAPAIADPPRAARGKRPSIYSAAQLTAWRSARPAGHRRPHDALPADLARPGERLTLGAFARKIGVDNKSVTQARDASLERIRQGRGRELDGGSIEIPDPVEGAHGVRGALYDAAALGWWWQHRPGKGRGGGASSHRNKRPQSPPVDPNRTA